MNMRLIVAVLVIATVICTPCARAQQQAPLPPADPPAWLPAGPGFHHWVVTNRPCNPSLHLYYTSTNGVASFIISSGQLRGFATYTEFQKWVVSEGLRLFGIIQTSIQPSTPIRFYLAILNLELEYGYAMSINVTNIGNSSQITSNSFIGLSPEWETGIVVVPGLQCFTVEVSDPPYSFTWTPTGTIKQGTGHPNEWTTTDLVVLNSWYALCEGRVRYTVVANGVTNQYTRLGFTIKPPVLKMLSASRVEVSLTPGSDTTVESSYNLSSWSKVSTISGLLCTNKVILPLSSSAPKRFFRAFSN